MQSSPLFDFVAPDGVQHTGWSVSDPVRYVSAFGQLNRLYIADGHHRWRVLSVQQQHPRKRMPMVVTTKNRSFLAVVFPHDQLRILPYNRVVADLNDLSAEEFLSKLRTLGSLEQAQAGTPEKPGQVLVFVDGEWWLLTFPESSMIEMTQLPALMSLFSKTECSHHFRHW